MFLLRYGQRLSTKNCSTPLLSMGFQESSRLMQTLSFAMHWGIKHLLQHGLARTIPATCLFTFPGLLTTRTKFQLNKGKFFFPETIITKDWSYSFGLFKTLLKAVFFLY